jgi:hypothetical protein
MRRLRSYSAAALLLLSVSSVAPRSAHGQTDADKATARTLGQEGQQALDKKDFKTAEDRFKRADALYHAPTLALGLARAYAGNGKYVEAQETYNRIVREGVPANAPPAFAKAVEDAKAEVGTVSPKIGSVVIVVHGTDNPKVTLDDQPVPVAALGVKRPANPGMHLVRASAEGFKSAEATVSVSEGGSATATLTLEKDPTAVAQSPAATPGAVVAPAAGPGGDAAPSPPPAKSSPLKLVGWIGVGLGGASLIAGGVTGAMAASKASELKNACPENRCPPDQQGNIDSYNTLGTVSTITLIGGGVLAAGGVALLLFSPSATTEVKAGSLTFQPMVGPGSLGATGTF